MTSSRSVRAPARPDRLAVGRAIIAAAWLGVVAAGAVLGASSEPSAVPGGDPGQTNIEAWLDVAFPAAAPVGKPYGFGVTLWDTTQNRFAEFNTAYVRLHPAKGSAKPTVGTASSDWPGHLIAEVQVPRGGPGALEIGLTGQVCTTRGSVESCANKEFPFRVAGSGPPPDAPRESLVVATTAEPRGPLLAGEAIDISVTVEPQAGWDPAALGLPDQLIAFANQRGGPDLASTALNDTGERGTSPAVTYSGQITIDEPGEVALQVAFPGNGTEDRVLPGATIRLRIEGNGVATSQRPAAPTPGQSVATGDGGPPWLLIAAIVAGVAVVGLAIQRAFADL